MTTLLKKSVRRESDACVTHGRKQRPLIISIHPGNVIGFRLKGCRKEELIAMRLAYTLAIRLRVQKENDEKRKAKGGKYLVNRGKL